MKKTVKTVTAGLLAATLIAAPAVALTGCGGSNGNAAKAGSTTLPESEVTEYIGKMRTSMGYDTDSAWANYLSNYGYTAATLREQAIDTLLDTKIIEEEAKKLNIKIEDSEVQKELETEIKRYGCANETEFASYIAPYGYENIDAYKKDIKNYLLQEAVVKKGCNIEADDASLSSAVLQSYQAGDNIAKVKIISFATDNTEASSVADKIKSGELKFDEAKTTYDNGYISDGWTSYVDYGETAIIKALANMKQGDISSLINGTYGNYIIKVEEIAPLTEENMKNISSLPQDFRDELGQAYISNKVSEMANSYLSGLKAKMDVTVYAMPSGLPYDINIEETLKNANSNTASSSGNATVSTAVSK